MQTSSTALACQCTLGANTVHMTLMAVRKQTKFVIVDQRNRKGDEIVKLSVSQITDTAVLGCFRARQ
ncbi:hypothetical protein E2C01_033522 [Portunus trituberculatus]|uniref:Uncharacterized protein n=1 Tax=Portunus trituberculatus TaxID=210409 RepID=A0A5B7F3Y7_PORTR|nr:hypothetical protein [Portunus trituberculatus]